MSHIGSRRTWTLREPASSWDFSASCIFSKDFLFLLRRGQWTVIEEEEAVEFPYVSFVSLLHVSVVIEKFSSEVTCEASDFISWVYTWKVLPPISDLPASLAVSSDPASLEGPCVS